MDTITVMTFFLAIFFGVYGSKLLSHHFGLIGIVAGFAAGFSIVVFLRFLIISLMCKLFPSHPPCRKGKCFSNDYEMVTYNQKDATFVFRCKCGTEYLRNNQYFREILPNGSLKPYMKKNVIGIWRPDDNNATTTISSQT